MRRLRAGTGRSFNCSLCTTLVQYRLAGCGLIPAIYLDSCGAHNNSQFNPVANKVGLTNCLELTGQRAHCHGQSLSLQERNDCSWVERWWLHFTQLNKLFQTVPLTESKIFNIYLCSHSVCFPSDWDRADHCQSCIYTCDVLHTYVIPTTSLQCPQFSQINKK